MPGCTSHHIRVDKLDELLKIYVRQVMEHSACHAGRGSTRNWPGSRSDVAGDGAESADRLAEVLDDLQEELKATKRQRIRDIDEAPGAGGASGGDL